MTPKKNGTDTDYDVPAKEKLHKMIETASEEQLLQLISLIEKYQS